MTSRDVRTLVHPPKGGTRRRRPVLALALYLPAPSLGAAAGLWLWPGPIGQAVWLASKAWLVLFPVTWTLVVERRGLEIALPTRRGLLEGLAQGLVIAAVIVGAWLLVGRQLVDEDAARDVLAAAGITSWPRFLVLAAGLSFVNSLVEEHAWRWFVTEQWRPLVGAAGAVLLSAACFTVHHAIALSAQVGVIAVLAGSAGVFAGGALWGWLRERHGSLWPGWVSHVLADLAVMAIGADILR